MIFVIQHKTVVQPVKNSWNVLEIKLESKKCASNNLLECKSEIKWMLPLKAKNLKTTFFEANSIEYDVGNDDDLLIGIQF